MQTNAQLATYRQRVKRCIPLLPALRHYSALLHGPCESCGCVLWAKVTGGYRCLKCCPPLSITTEHREMITTATDGDLIFMCSRNPKHSTVFRSLF